MGARISDMNRNELLAVLAELGRMENEQLRLEAMMPVFGCLAELDRILGSALGNWEKLSPEVALAKARELAAKGESQE
jgi:amino acid permease